MPAGTWSTEQNPSAVAVAKGIMTGTTTRRVMGVAFLSPPRSPSTRPAGSGPAPGPPQPAAAAGSPGWRVKFDNRGQPPSGRDLLNTAATRRLSWEIIRQMNSD